MRVIGLKIILILCLFGCSSPDDDSDYCNMAYKIMDQFVKDMKQKHSLNMYAYGGSFLDQINWLSLSFETLGPMSKDELREFNGGSI